MTGPRAGSYRTLLSRPGVLLPVLLAAVGRLGYAMLPLLLLFTIRDASASFTTAATAMSAYGLTGLVMPLKARVIDRRGQRSVLPLLGVVTLVVVEMLVVVAASGTLLPDAAWVALAVAAGVVAPPLGPSMRAQWRVIAPDDTDTAYALDGTTEEVLWLVGPALAGVLLGVTGPTAGLAVVPLLLAIGAVALGLSSWQPPRGEQDPTRAGALRSGALWPVLVTMALTGVATALLLTGVAATADAVGSRGLAAVGEVAIGAGAVLGGLAWGHHRPAASRRAATATLALIWAATVGVVSLLGVSAPALVLLALAGAASAPVWVLAYGAADHAVAPGARTEASTWVTTAANLGSAGGTALTGVLVASSGASSALTAAGVVAAGAALVTLATWRRLG